MCGFIGVIGPASFPVAPLIYNGLIATQHRGQDAAGITTYDGRFHLHKAQGLVRDAFPPDSMTRLTGGWGLGQVRYPTIGGGGIENAQPFITDQPYGIAMVHNGQVTNFKQLRDELEQRDRRYVNSENDVEIILHVFAHELGRIVRKDATIERNSRVDSNGRLADDDGADGLPSFDQIARAVAKALDRVQGAFAVAGLIAKSGLIAFRDPYGIRPAILGRRDTPDGPAYMVASESCALDLNSFETVSDIAPGELIHVDTHGKLHRAIVGQRGRRPCIFEHIYFARPDSMIDEISVYKTRLRQGELLAKKWRSTLNLPVDVVMPVPDSARHAALEMARVLGAKYREGLVKNRYIGRTFIMPGTTDRRAAVRSKLNPIRLEFDGKDVLLVDDSIVRGNTVKELIMIARENGARNVYFASYSAPLVSPCVYGIDMSTRHDFVARDRTLDEIRQAVGADALIYQDLPDMVAGAREGNPDISEFCMACFTGEYPTGPLSADMLADFEQDRRQPVPKA